MYAVIVYEKKEAAEFAKQKMHNYYIDATLLKIKVLS